MIAVSLFLPSAFAVETAHRPEPSRAKALLPAAKATPKRLHSAKKKKKPARRALLPAASGALVRDTAGPATVPERNSQVTTRGEDRPAPKSGLPEPEAAAPGSRSGSESPIDLQPREVPVEAPVLSGAHNPPHAPLTILITRRMERPFSATPPGANRNRAGLRPEHHASEPGKAGRAPLESNPAGLPETRQTPDPDHSGRAAGGSLQENPISGVQANDAFGVTKESAAAKTHQTVRLQLPTGYSNPVQYFHVEETALPAGDSVWVEHHHVHQMPLESGESRWEPPVQPVIVPVPTVDTSVVPVPMPVVVAPVPAADTTVVPAPVAVVPVPAPDTTVVPVPVPVVVAPVPAADTTVVPMPVVVVPVPAPDTSVVPVPVPVVVAPVPAADTTIVPMPVVVVPVPAPDTTVVPVPVPVVVAPVPAADTTIVPMPVVVVPVPAPDTSVVPVPVAATPTPATDSSAVPPVIVSPVPESDSSEVVPSPVAVIPVPSVDSSLPLPADSALVAGPAGMPDTLGSVADSVGAGSPSASDSVQGEMDSVGLAGTPDSTLDSSGAAGTASGGADSTDPEVPADSNAIADTDTVEATVTIAPPWNRFDIPGPVSDYRDRNFRPENMMLQGLYEIHSPGNQERFLAYDSNYILSKSVFDSLGDAARALDSNYSLYVRSRLSEITIKKVEEELFVYTYPAGYGGNSQAASVKVKRIVITAWAPDSGNVRRICAYHLNYDREYLTPNSVVLQINGHFGGFPSRTVMGLEDNGGYSGSPVAKLAIQGVPIITYDDSRNNLAPAGDLGESSAGNHERDGLFHTLEDMLIVEKALLMRFDRVDGMGISGGAERLYHFLALHSCRLATAYLAGFNSPGWMRGDVDMAVRGDSVRARMQLTDLALIGAHRKVDLIFGVNTGEGGSFKANLMTRFLPDLRRYTDRFEIHGDDADGDGWSEGRTALAHEYDLGDYLHYLSVRRLGIGSGHAFLCARVMENLENPAVIAATASDTDRLYSPRLYSTGALGASLFTGEVVADSNRPVVVLKGLVPDSVYRLEGFFEGVREAPYRYMSDTGAMEWKSARIWCYHSGAQIAPMADARADHAGEIRIQLGDFVEPSESDRGSWLQISARLRLDMPVVPPPAE